MIGLLGIKKSGKSSAALEASSLGFERLYFSRSLKELIYKMCKMDDSCKVSDEKSTRNYSLNLKALDAFLNSRRLVELTSYEEAAILGAWDTLSVKEVYRFLMQYVGTEVCRTRDPEIWINLLSLYISKNKKNHKQIIIDDVRFPNEADFVQKFKPSVLIKIQRPTVSNNSIHTSETELHNINCDHIILNTGSIEELLAQLRSVIGKHHGLFTKVR